MNNDFNILYFFAYWDNASMNKSDFVKICRCYNVHYELIDVETENGMKMSSKFGIKMCPRIVVLKGKKVYKILNGRHLSTLEDILHGTK